MDPSKRTGGASGAEGPQPPALAAPLADDDFAVFQAILEGTVRNTGAAFFQSLVRHLATAIDVRYAFVAEFAAVNTRVRTLAYWAVDRIVDNLEWDLGGTPCEEVIKSGLCHHSDGVWRKFPHDAPLVDMHIESYLGVPLLSAQGVVLGHLAVFDERSMSDERRRMSVFQIFAQRAAAELERLRMETAVQESEARFRDLFEEAPIPYVYEGTDTCFLQANRAFKELLGLGPGDVPGTYGLSLVAQTPEDQERVHDALGAEKQGVGKGYIELELRRKDDGRPVWVQRWSKPEPDGKHTRTMIIDITARVLAEREKARLLQQNLYLQEEIKAGTNFEEIVGTAPPLLGVFKQIEQVAATDATVLILGETGTGKELIARAIHNRSPRRDRPLIKLNCAAMPTGLVESELFGHEKGAFTGASEKRVGRFALAHQGTIFLDEIGDMPLEVQVRLLRVLQEREFEPVGSTRTIAVDVRVIAATNRDLRQAVADGKFRADLYYRLNIFPIEVPTLGQRTADIPLLVHYFVNKYASRIGKRISEVDPETMARLVAYPWPGNVRELENVIERAVILSSGPLLEVDPDAVRAAPGGAASALRGPALTLADGERQQILAALDQTDGVIEGPRGAAKILGLNPNTLRSRMKKLEIARRAK
jgi:formate hydrogenlyase transcriptional activator